MTRPLVIAHLIATNFYGGPERQILTHAKRLGAVGMKPLIISFKSANGRNETLEIAERAGIDTASLSEDFPFNPANVFMLRSLLRSRRVNMLVSHGYKGNVIGRLASWLCGIPSLAVSRGWTAETSRVRFYEKLDRLFLRFADQVVAVSHGQCEKILKAGIPSGKVQVIYNAIDLAAMPGLDAEMPERKRLGIPADALLVGSAGRLSPEKNHIGFVQAAAKVLRHRDDVHFVVWGEGVLRAQLEQEIRTLGLSGRFHMPGFCKEASRHFHELDIFVLPSHTEGLSNVILEAYACSKPVVATAVGGNPEVVTDGVSGFLTPAGDTDALADAVLKLAASSDLRLGMGRAGREQVARHFDFDAQTGRYADLYSSLAFERGAAT